MADRGTRILVTDGEQRSALAAVRSLGRLGHTVYVCSRRRRSLAGASRYSAGEVATPDPLRSPDGFAAAIAKFASERRIEWVLPIAEPSILSLLDNRQLLGEVGLPFPEAATFRHISDKKAVMEEALRAGVAVPPQIVVPTAAEAARLLPGQLRYPLVLKPSRSVADCQGAAIRLSVRHAADEQELRRALEAIPTAGYPVLVQERILGPGIGIFLLLWKGTAVATFSHRRIREKPPAGGVSVYRESWPMDAGLLERSQALLRAFRWQGVAMVEYKLDAATGTPYIMEINGRLWGSLQLAIDAGVDFPALLIAVARGENPRPVESYRTGVRLRWTLGEVDHLLARLRRSPRELALPPGAPGRGGALLDFLAAFGPRSRGEILRVGDPLPALRESVDWVRRR